MVHVHDGPFFTATMMKVGVIRDETSAFSFFQTTLGKCFMLGTQMCIHDHLFVQAMTM